MPIEVPHEVQSVMQEYGFDQLQRGLCQEETPFDSFCNRSEELIANPRMFWVVTPRSKRHLVWKIVAHGQVHIPSTRADISTDDDVMPPWERQHADCLHERFHLLIRYSRLQADHQNVTKHAPNLARPSRPSSLGTTNHPDEHGDRPRTFVGRRRKKGSCRKAGVDSRGTGCPSSPVLGTAMRHIGAVVSDQKRVRDRGGQTRRSTFPTISDLQIGPQKRLSQESVRLSPMTKYSFAGILNGSKD